MSGQTPVRPVQPRPVSPQQPSREMPSRPAVNSSTPSRSTMTRERTTTPTNAVRSIDEIMMQAADVDLDSL